MSLLAFYGFVVTISLTGVMAPGPLTALLIARGRSDPLAGAWVTAGHAAAEVPLIVGLILGLQPLLETPGVRGSLALAGGLVLLWLGVRTISHSAMGGEKYRPSNGQRNTFVEGILLTAFNPYWFLWWLTVGAGLISLAQPHGWAAGLFGMTVVHLGADALWAVFLTASVHKGGRAFSPRAWRAIEWLCGLSMMGFGIYFFSSVFTGRTP